MNSPTARSYRLICRVLAMINYEKNPTTCIFYIQVVLMGELATLSIVEQVASHLREILHNRNAPSAWLSLQKSSLSPRRTPSDFSFITTSPCSKSTVTVVNWTLEKGSFCRTL